MQFNRTNVIVLILVSSFLIFVYYDLKSNPIEKNKIPTQHVKREIPSEYFENNFSKRIDPNKDRVILVTGGTGFIGSHVVLDLLEHNHKVVVIDNLVNSKTESLNRIARILKEKGKQHSLVFHRIDLQNKTSLEWIFRKYEITSVFHFAALKAVGESVEKPLDYYENNLSGTVNLLKMMQKYKVKNIVFSSSATVYDPSGKPPYVETDKIGSINPYGRTKEMMEKILLDWGNIYDASIVILRYFNPVGAHPSGLMGENPLGIPNNLVPFVSKVAVGKIDLLKIFGNDYETEDGTAERDYIHILDLSTAHVLSMKKFGESGVHIYNIGTGKATTVLGVVKALNKACGKSIPYKFFPRRSGDAASSFCDPSKAKKELGFEPKYDIDDMLRDTWNWQKNNPDGY
eukprot:TRINITY_DN15250_c0_g1_i1.p1 TRINITY_DN15250_c0_g1~~TRINITY_DN15250_c0_g1_i1.p1  ORF type:complete len:401 (+),score=119.06 TRINITY_DN15250_c0_g1_i1:23-1225(+)